MPPPPCSRVCYPSDGNGEVLLMPVVNHCRVRDPSSHLFDDIIRRAGDKKIGSASCSQGVSTIVLRSYAQHLHGALDARDQSVVRQGLGPQEPCPAEAAHAGSPSWLRSNQRRIRETAFGVGRSLKNIWKGPPVRWVLERAKRTLMDVRPGPQITSRGRSPDTISPDRSNPL